MKAPPCPARRAPTWSMLVLLLAGPSAARAELSAVWAVDDGNKVKADDAGHPLARKNGIFDGETIRLFGVRNETVAFQLILEGGAAETTAVAVRLDRVGAIENDAASVDPDRYFVGRRIELLQQVYLDVARRSSGLVWQVWNEGTPEQMPEVPAGLDGPVPDPLVPLDLLPGGFTVAAGRNQGVWIDIYIPKGTDPGLHRGTLVVEVDGAPCALAACQLPLELEVIDATLPDRAAVKTMLYFSGRDPRTVLARYFDAPDDVGEEQMETLRERHFKLARRHLVTLFEGQDDGPTAHLDDRLSGRAFERGAGYEGWGEGVGQDIYAINTYGSQALEPIEVETWTGYFAADGRGHVEFFLYAFDEPAPAQFPRINENAARSKPVPSFVTTDYTTELDQVDIFCVLAETYSRGAAAEARAAGKRVWAYNGMRPFSGTFALDDVAVSPRVNPWIQLAHGIPRWFYWEATHYEDYQGTGEQIDVWDDPLNYRNTAGWQGDWVNGDGLLIYPGRDRLFPGSDRGFAGPLPSIRLKNWRRGIQDAAYLRLAEIAGQDAVRDAAIARLIPAVLDDKSYHQPVSWVEDGEVWLAVRRELAAAIVGINDAVFEPDARPPLAGASAAGPALVGGCGLADPGTGGLAPLLLLVLCLLIRGRR